MTAGDCQVRFKEHQFIGNGRVITPVYQWIHREWRCGYPVECVLLEWCEYGSRDDVETQWINKFPNLLNDRKVYYRPNKKPPIIPAIKNYRRGFVFNSGGFRGIHWWRDYDMYAVFLGGSWLSGGDSVPGGGGNIYFSCRTDALRLRDIYRRGMRGWLLDIAQEVDFGAQVSDACGLDFDPNIHAAECDTANNSEFAGTIV
jgi:hypothetical protein